MASRYIVKYSNGWVSDKTRLTNHQPYIGRGLLTHLAVTWYTLDNSCVILPGKYGWISKLWNHPIYLCRGDLYTLSAISKKSSSLAFHWLITTASLSVHWSDANTNTLVNLILWLTLHQCQSPSRMGIDHRLSDCEKSFRFSWRSSI